MTRQQKAESLKRRYGRHGAPESIGPMGGRGHGPGRNMGMGPKRLPRNAGTTTRRLLHYLNEDKPKMVLAFFCGALAGFVTALLQTKLGVQPILAGIITMTALYSVNLMVMGKPNINFFKEKTIFTAAEAMPGGFGSLLQAAAITAVLCVLLVLFLRTQLGLSLRATGDNRDMVSASSINPAFTTTVGLCLSNAVVALSGALIAQYQKFADNTLGTGMVVIGLASLIIGEVLFGRGGPHALAKGVLAATVGAVVYRIIVAAAIAVNIDAKNMKLVSALIVAAAISYPAIRDKVLFYRKRREANRNV